MKAGLSADSRSIQSVQALRALAALLVVFEHVDMAKVGAFGVDIFFVISGFVIAYVSRTDTPARFMLKRLFRIIPLYWSATVLVFLVACLAPWALKSTTNDLGDLIKSLLFIPYMKDSGAVQPVLFLGWTLNYEMFFYAIFAVSMVIWPKMPAIPATVAILSLIVFGLVFEASFDSRPILDRTPHDGVCVWSLAVRWLECTDWVRFVTGLVVGGNFRSYSVDAVGSN